MVIGILAGADNISSICPNCSYYA